VWKVYRIDTDEIIKGGFASEDDGKEWLERQRFADDEDVAIDEMDSDEEEQWLEAHRSESEDGDEGSLDDRAGADLTYGDEENLDGLSFNEDSDDDYYDEDDEDLDEEDEDEDYDEEDE
jgi:hypothetical protein